MKSSQYGRIRIGTTLAIISVSALVLGGLSMAQDRSAGGKKAPQVYKNIKILKDLPADQVIPIMRKIDDSLGVRCDFCHIVTAGPGGRHEGFEKDDKPMKGVARQMMTMTGDLDKKVKVVKGKVTCFTCHHGRAEPENNAPMAPGRR
jgi:hypothetical protein